MPTWKNITKHPIRFNVDGVNPKGRREVEPGKTFSLDEEQAYLVGSQINAQHVELVEVKGETKAEK